MSAGEFDLVCVEWCVIRIFFPISASEKRRQTPLRPRAAGWIMLENQGKTSGLPLPSPAKREPAVSPALLEEYRGKEKQTPKSTRCLMISFDLILLQSVSFAFPPPTTAHPAAKYRDYMKTQAEWEPGMVKPLRKQLFVCSCATFLPLSCLITRACGEEEESLHLLSSSTQASDTLVSLHNSGKSETTVQRLNALAKRLVAETGLEPRSSHRFPCLLLSLEVFTGNHLHIS